MGRFRPICGQREIEIKQQRRPSFRSCEVYKGLIAAGNWFCGLADGPGQRVCTLLFGLRECLALKTFEKSIENLQVSSSQTESKHLDTILKKT